MTDDELQDICTTEQIRLRISDEKWEKLTGGKEGLWGFVQHLIKEHHKPQSLGDGELRNKIIQAIGFAVQGVQEYTPRNIEDYYRNRGEWIETEADAILHLKNQNTPVKESVSDTGTTPDSSIPDDAGEYEQLQRIYLDWHNGKRPYSGYIKAIQAYTTTQIEKAVVAAEKQARLDTIDKIFEMSPGKSFNLWKPTDAFKFYERLKAYEQDLKQQSNTNAVISAQPGEEPKHPPTKEVNDMSLSKHQQSILDKLPLNEEGNDDFDSEITIQCDFCPKCGSKKSRMTENMAEYPECYQKNLCSKCSSYLG